VKVKHVTLFCGSSCGALDVHPVFYTCPASSHSYSSLCQRPLRNMASQHHVWSQVEWGPSY